MPLKASVTLIKFVKVYSSVVIRLSYILFFLLVT